MMIYGKNEDWYWDDIDDSGEWPDTPEYTGEEWDRYEGEREERLAEENEE